MPLKKLGQYCITMFTYDFPPVACSKSVPGFRDVIV